jgi:hypothetical protein
MMVLLFSVGRLSPHSVRSVERDALESTRSTKDSDLFGSAAALIAPDPVPAAFAAPPARPP